MLKFAAIQKNTDKNRWDPVQQMLIKFYNIGKSKEGERAYSPLLLFKCMLLQKWFQIKSDPELESQINDRISFKSFLDLPMDCPSPDHSTFSRFRKRLSKDAMVQINSILLKQFYQLGLKVNEGVAVDARLVKSASKPLSSKKMEEFKKHLDSPAGKLDKNGDPRKYTRDHESDWVIKNEKPHYGLKEHASVDVQYGFILATTHNDSKYLPYAVCYSMHAGKILVAYADKGYTGAPNREFPALNNIKDGIMRKDNINAKLTDFEIQRNKAISKYRYIVEQYFGISHKYDNGDRARFPQLMKNITDIMFRQFAFNLKKGAKILEIIPV